MADETKAETKAEPKQGELDLQAKIKAAEEKASKLELEAKTRQEKEEADAKKAKDKIAIEEGKLKEVLAQKEAQLETLIAASKEAEKREVARAEKLVAALPDALKVKAEKLKGKLGLGDFVEYLEAEHESLGAAGGTKSMDDSGKKKAPPYVAGAPGGIKGAPNGERELDPDSARVLEDMFMVDTTAARTMLVHEKDPHGNSRFVMPIKTMIADMRARAGTPTRLTREAAEKRVR